VDGCYYSGNGNSLNVILHPSQFSDNENGTPIGTPKGGFPTQFAVVEKLGVQWIYPTAGSGSESTGLPDSWGVDALSPCLYTGGNYAKNTVYGIFYVGYGRGSSSYSSCGSRLMKLP
jgi:hypothetical protein